MPKAKPESLLPLGETIDRLTLLELRPGSHIAWGLVGRLYEGLRRKVNYPQCLLGAEKLFQAVKRNDLIIIITGWAVPPYIPIGETDGPLGAASLARAINFGLKAKVLVLTDQGQVDMIKATCRSAELRIVPPEAILKTPLAIAVMPFPFADHESSRREAARLLREFAPSAAISIERAGRNERDVYHTALGADMSGWTAKLDYVLTEARQAGVLTIGIGDWGNEAGLGKIIDHVREFMPNGAKCTCPCGHGMATVVEADVTIVSICANLGAYGITACLSALLEQPELLQGAEIEENMIRECIRNGGMEGVQAAPSLQWPVDSIPHDAYVNVAKLMRSAVEQSMRHIPLYRQEIGI
jgi:hypothetical protein